MKRLILALSALALGVGAASAHIVLDGKEAAVGASFKATFRVTHGCEGAATIALKVRIPEGLIGAKPMPKSGWSLATAKGPYARSYAFYHGRTLLEGVREVVWSGGDLPDEFVDEFSLVGFVAKELEAGGALTFPVVQECTGGKRTEWVEVAKDAGDHPDRPAPQAKLVAPDPHAGH